VTAYEQELKENGFNFATQNRVAAEDTVKDMYRLIKDDDTPAAVKVKIHELFVENANLKPKNTMQADATTPGFSIQIVLPGQAATTQTPR